MAQVHQRFGFPHQGDGQEDRKPALLAEDTKAVLRAEDTLRDSEEESDDSLSSAEDYSEPEEENGQHWKSRTQWTGDEYERMEKAINRNTVGGKISWVGVAAEMKNERTPHAYECRRHLGYPKLLRAHQKWKKKLVWTRQDDTKLMRVVGTGVTWDDVGKSWKPLRSGSSCRRRYLLLEGKDSFGDGADFEEGKVSAAQAPKRWSEVQRSRKTTTSGAPATKPIVIELSSDEEDFKPAVKQANKNANLTASAPLNKAVISNFSRKRDIFPAAPASAPKRLQSVTGTSQANVAPALNNEISELKAELFLKRDQKEGLGFELLDAAPEAREAIRAQIHKLSSEIGVLQGRFMRMQDSS